MPGFFITKKAKKAMKERRKKAKLAEKGLLLNEQKQVPASNANAAADKTKKRPRMTEEESIMDSLQNQVNTGGSTGVIANKKGKKAEPIVIVVPAGLSSKQAAKFRKDARRNVRSEGKNDSLVQFVQEGDEKSVVKKSKKQQSFPCINDLVKQQAIAKHEAEKQSSMEELSDDYKDKYVALDCEMVGIGPAGRLSALARVSMVNWAGETLLDTYVKVPTKVTDFRTFVSGVKPHHLSSDAAMEPNECREVVAKLLKHKVLVGHSLKNDLHALLLAHPAADIRDTGHYRPFNRLANNGKWRPRKLRDLVKEHCGLVIQADGQAHDSVDDAKATMLLFQTCHVAWEKELALKQQQKSAR